MTSWATEASILPPPKHYTHPPIAWSQVGEQQLLPSLMGHDAPVWLCQCFTTIFDLLPKIASRR